MRPCLIVLLLVAATAHAQSQTVWNDSTIQRGALKAYPGVRDVDKLTELVTAGASTDEEKVASIYAWITGNIRYDVRWLNRKNFRAKGIEEVLRKRRTTCTGYVWLFRQMCDNAGIDHEEIAGYAEWVFHRNERLINSANHVWMAHEYGPAWGITDPTFGAGFLVQRKQPIKRFIWKYFGTMYRARFRFVQKRNWAYFNADVAALQLTHYPDHPMWQTQFDTISSSRFVKAPQEKQRWATEEKNQGSESVDFQFQIRRYKASRATNSDVLFIARACFNSNKHNSFDMASGYAIKARDWIVQEQFRIKNNRRHISDTLACDSVIALLDTAIQWNKHTRRGLRPYLSNELSKIYALRKDVHKKNYAEIYKLSRESSYMQKNMITLRRERSKLASLKSNLNNAARNANKVKPENSDAKRQGKKLAVYMAMLDSIQLQIDSTYTSVLSYRNNVSVGFDRLEQQVLVRDSILWSETFAKDSVAGMRLWLDFYADSAIAQTQRRFMAHRTSGHEADTSVTAAVTGFTLTNKQLKTDAARLGKLWQQQRELLVKCMKADLPENGQQWRDRIRAVGDSAKAQITRANRMFAESHALLVESYGLVKDLSKKYRRVSGALKGEIKAAYWAASQYRFHEYKRHRLLVNITQSEYESLKRNLQLAKAMRRSARYKMRNGDAGNPGAQDVILVRG
jgi:hypothetical protein